MAASPCNYDALDRRSAFLAGLSFTTIHAVFQLEKTFLTFRIYIVGNAGSSEADGFMQHLLQTFMEPTQFIRGERRRPSSGPHFRAVQAFVRINVPHAAEQFLIQQCAFDGSLSPTKQSNEICQRD